MLGSEIDTARRKRSKRVAWARRAWLAIPLAMGGTLTLVELELLTLPTPALLTLIAGIPGVAVLDSVIQGLREKSIGTIKDEELDRYKACVALAAEVHDLTGIDQTIIGVSVWGIHTPKKRWWQRGADLEPSLFRLTRFRLSAHPMPSNASWTKGKGVIGRCWEDEAVKFVDWGPIQRAYESLVTMSESKWGTLSDDRRWGFSKNQYLEGIRKYAQVLAVPIKDEHGVFLGCVSVDIPTADPNLVPPVPVGAKLDGGDVRNSMTRAAHSLRSWV